MTILFNKPWRLLWEAGPMSDWSWTHCSRHLSPAAWKASIFEVHLSMLRQPFLSPLLKLANGVRSTRSPFWHFSLLKYHSSLGAAVLWPWQYWGPYLARSLSHAIDEAAHHCLLSSGPNTCSWALVPQQDSPMLDIGWMLYPQFSWVSISMTGSFAVACNSGVAAAQNIMV